MSNRMETIIPDKTKNLRACLRCHLVKTAEQFKAHGCNNCQSSSNITKKFEGFLFLAITKPQDSWVAKWVKISGLSPGIYCLKPHGNLNEE